MAKYVQANAKKSFAETSKHTHETGGGPAPQALVLVSEKKSITHRSKSVNLSDHIKPYKGCILMWL